jgi:hypothetical protein
MSQGVEGECNMLGFDVKSDGTMNKCVLLQLCTSSICARPNCSKPTQITGHNLDSNFRIRSIITNHLQMCLSSGA